MKRFVPLLVVCAIALAGCSEDPSGLRQAAETGGQETMQLASQRSTQPVQSSRAVIRTGKIMVRVADVEKAEREATDWATKSGGFVSASNSTGFDSLSPSVALTLRTPSSRFDDAMDYVESLGTRLQKEIKSEDVTTQIVDFDARMKTMAAQEVSLRGMLSKSRNMNDTLAITKELTTIRSEIESISAQRKSMADRASLSTIEVTFVGEARTVTTSSAGWAKEAWNGSTFALTEIGRGLGSLGIFLVVFLPVWAPVAILFWWLIRKSMRPTPPPKYQI